ncbi:MAG: hypothetical protein ACRD5M_12320 [Candidatus Acidiferrales bacterium]
MMAHDIYNTPSGRSRRWGHRRHSRRNTPSWARYILLLLSLALIGTLIWVRTSRLLWRTSKYSPPATAAPAAAVQPAQTTWQRDVANSLETAQTESRAGNITQAEVAMDRAAAFVTAAKYNSEAVTPDFFDSSLARLDRAVATHPENARLSEHATLMRIELAQLRSSLEAAPAQPVTAVTVAIDSPRAVARDAVLDPATLGGNILDATDMPSSSEILEPPFSRQFADNVQVQNLTLSGATQTIDGIRWENVTFIGTRLRYQGGEVSLQNVHCVRCTFGFAIGDRGARLAIAFALGKTSLVIE